MNRPLRPIGTLLKLLLTLLGLGLISIVLLVAVAAINRYYVSSQASALCSEIENQTFAKFGNVEDFFHKRGLSYTREKMDSGAVFYSVYWRTWLTGRYQCNMTFEPGQPLKTTLDTQD